MASTTPSHLSPAGPPARDGRSPDPSAITSEQIRHEVFALRELIEARLDGYDRAIQLIQTAADKVPSITDLAIGQLKSVVEEKFVGVANQFNAAKEAVAARSTASEQAIAKSEAATTKQIDSLAALIATGSKGQEDKIVDLRTRLTEINGQSKGVGMSVSTIFSVIAAIASIASIIGVIVVLTRN